MVAHICGKCRERFATAEAVHAHGRECTPESRAERSFGEAYRGLSPAGKVQIDCVVDVAMRFNIVPMDLLLALKPYREAVLDEIRELAHARPEAVHTHPAPMVPHYPPAVYPPVGTIAPRLEGPLPPGWKVAYAGFMEYEGQPEIRQSDAD